MQPREGKEMMYGYLTELNRPSVDEKGLDAHMIDIFWIFSVIAVAAPQEYNDSGIPSLSLS